MCLKVQEIMALKGEEWRASIRQQRCGSLLQASYTCSKYAVNRQFTVLELAHVTHFYCCDPQSLGNDHHGTSAQWPVFIFSPRPAITAGVSGPAGRGDRLLLRRWSNGLSVVKQPKDGWCDRRNLYSWWSMDYIEWALHSTERYSESLRLCNRPT